MACAACTSPAALDGARVRRPRVSVRSEPFGALLYHVGTRRLSWALGQRGDNGMIRARQP
jgi:hypothetical protein